jgi:hypothetical protein
MIRLFFTIIVLTLTSCVTEKACNKKFPQIFTIRDSVIIKDSVSLLVNNVVEVKQKDSIVIVKRQSGETEFKDRGDDFNQTFTVGGNKFYISRTNGIVKFSYDLEGYISQFKDKEKTYLSEIKNLQKRYSELKSSKQEVRVSVIKHIPKWIWYLIAFLSIPWVWYIIRNYL